MILHGKYKPTIPTAEKICKALGLGLKDIFDIEDLKIPEIDELIKFKVVENGNT